VAILLGVALGISAMMPLWLKQRRLATQANKQLKLTASKSTTPVPAKATHDADDELGI